jgi:hypothetical protein
MQAHASQRRQLSAFPLRPRRITSVHYVEIVTELPFTRHTFSIPFGAHRVAGQNKGEGFVLDQRKQAVSIRLGESDLRNIKRMARRLGVRDSDIIRFAIKSMLHRISPLCDDGITGRNLVPVLVESGDELIRHFEFDTYRLERIINERAQEDARVDHDDIALLAMNGLREHYLLMRLNDNNGAPTDAGQAHSLRAYLYDKYVYRNDEGKQAEPRAAADAEVRVGPQRSATVAQISKIAG